MFYIVGLGNPGDEYLNTRHNAGRMVVSKLLKDLDFDDFEFNKKTNSQVSKGSIKIGRNKEEKVTLILPETFMNKSGNALSYFVKPVPKAASAKASTSRRKGLENLIVVHDDIDLALGAIKISYNKGTGGHRGLDSIVKVVKTKEFVRIRIGVSPATSKGKIKKPQGEKDVIDFILNKFKPKELELMKKIFKKSSEAIQTLITDGRDKAMNIFNS